MKIVSFIIALILLGSCNQRDSHSQQQDLDTDVLAMPKSFASIVQENHLKTLNINDQALEFDIVLSFGGKERLNARMKMSLDSRFGLFEMKDGSRIVYKDGEVLHNTSKSEESARFAAYTWSYFALLPYKLNDSGTIWTDYPTKELNEKVYNVEKLQFDPGTGDAPDDWYIIYADKKTSLIEVAAYIVTAGKSREEAEKDPHAIKYHDYIDVDGYPVSTRWTFWEWRTEGGLTKQLGEASIKKVKFSKAKEIDFQL